jgi:hypothetical protein
VVDADQEQGQAQGHAEAGVHQQLHEQVAADLFSTNPSFPRSGI